MEHVTAMTNPHGVDMGQPTTIELHDMKGLLHFWNSNYEDEKIGVEGLHMGKREKRKIQWLVVTTGEELREGG